MDVDILFQILIVIVFVAIYVIWLMISEPNKCGDAENRYYELNYKYTNKGMYANTYSEAKRCLDVLEKNYPGDAAIHSRLSRQIYHEDMKDLRSWVNDLKEGEKEEWELPAKSALSSFYHYYLLVTEYTFDNVEKIKHNKEKCLYWWDRYFSVPVPNETINRVAFLEKWKHYDPIIMRSKESICEKLDSCINESSVVYKRKRKLVAEIRKIIMEKGSIARSTIFSQCIEGYTSDEVKQAYDWMKRNRRISEEKIGNRYYVTLRKKEKSEVKTEG